MSKPELSYKDIGVCIIFFEKLDQTIECIRSVLRTSQLGLPNVYVFNNNSSPESTKKLKEFCSGHKTVHYFHSDKNIGPSGGRNYMINHSKEKWLLFLDNDIVIRTKSWQKRILRHIQRSSETEVFVPVLYNKHDFFFCRYDAFQVSEGKLVSIKRGDKTINNFPGGASFVNRKLFDRIGLYDPEMFPAFEDVELSIRAMKMGEEITATKIRDILLIHDHRKAVSNKDKTATNFRYNNSLNENCYNRLHSKYQIDLGNGYLEWANKERDKILMGVNFFSALYKFIRGKLPL